MINRINHHVYTNDYIYKNQYGFTPQLSTIDGAMAVNLDVEGAFNSAWLPNILKRLKESGCPRDLYNLTWS